MSIERLHLHNSETQDSRLRELTNAPVRMITDHLHKTFPGLRPNHITALGLIGVAVGSLIAAQRSPKNNSKDEILSKMTIVSLSFFSLLDRFDGALAKKLNAESPGSHNETAGGVIDAISDRSQEFIMAISRTKFAKKRGDKIGETMALLNAITNTLPSTAKAFAETQGIAVPEHGKKLWGFTGSRLGRAVLNILATSYPESASIRLNSLHFSLQALNDAFVTAGNIINTIDRLKSSQNKERKTLSETTKEHARYRLAALILFSAITTKTALPDKSNDRKNSPSSS